MNKIFRQLQKTPIWTILFLIAIALSILVAQVVKLIKEDDTQGVVYDQARLKAYRSGQTGSPKR